jgi:hypothetical protein
VRGRLGPTIGSAVLEHQPADGAKQRTAGSRAILPAPTAATKEAGRPGPRCGPSAAPGGPSPNGQRRPGLAAGRPPGGRTNDERGPARATAATTRTIATSCRVTRDSHAWSMIGWWKVAPEGAITARAGEPSATRSARRMSASVPIGDRPGQALAVDSCRMAWAQCQLSRSRTTGGRSAGAGTVPSVADANSAGAVGARARWGRAGRSPGRCAVSQQLEPLPR